MQSSRLLKQGATHSDGRPITLQVAVLLLTTAVAAQAIICQFDDPGFESSIQLFGHNVQSALAVVLSQGGTGDVYQGGQRGSLSPGTHSNVNCC